MATYKLDEGNYGLLVKVHHIIADGCSIIDTYIAVIKEIVQFCMQQGERYLTPTDFETASIS